MPNRRDPGAAGRGSKGAGLSAPPGVPAEWADLPRGPPYSFLGLGDGGGAGFADWMVGTHAADPNGAASGARSVGFGRADWSDTAGSVALSALDGTDGFVLNGVVANDFSGTAVSGAGDVNGDGFADLIIGANGADPGTGQLRYGRFRGHRHVNSYPVTLVQAEFFQNIGHPAHPLVRLAIGDVFFTARVVSFPDNGRLIAALIEVAVNAVVAGVQHAVLVPADVKVGEIQGDILDHGGEPDPVQSFCRVRPELLAVLNGFPVNSLVFLLINKLVLPE